MTNQKSYEDRKKAIEERAAKELQNLQREQEVINELPLVPARVFFSGSLGVWLTYEAANVQEANEIMQKFEVLPYLIVKDGCTTIKPEDLFKADELEKVFARGKFDEMFGPCVDLEKASYTHGTAATLIFWTKINDTIYRVSIEIKDHPWNIQTTYSNPRNPANSRSVDHTAPWELGACYRRVRWATSDNTSARFGFYFYDKDEFLQAAGLSEEE